MTEIVAESEVKNIIFRQGVLFSSKFRADATLDPSLKGIGADGPDVLNLGSGVNPLPGAVNVDLQNFPGVNLSFDFTQTWPLPDASFDKVTLFHCLEHVEPLVALQIMREAYRVLRETGAVIAEVPDMVGLCERLVAGNYGMLVGAIYGGHDAPEDGHRFGYTASSLALLCHLAGFVRLITKPGTDYHADQMPTLRVEAIKVRRRTPVAA